MDPQLLLYSSRNRVREILVAGLLQCDFQVADFTSPYLAVISAGKSPIDLLIIDITPADTRGMLIVRAFKKSDRLKSIPILLLIPAEPANLLDALCHEYFENNRDCAKARPAILAYPFNFAELVKKANGLAGRA
jgi:hypothetical protein